MPEITVIAHNIRSIHNVGSIFRTCEGFGVARIILSGYTPYPTFDGDQRLPHEAEKITKQIHKTALDAETMMPFEYHESLDTWLQQIDMPIIALEQAPLSVPIHKFTPPARFALLLGEEVHGITSDLLDQCSATIEIPMYGKKESFNVSVAAGVALYALTTST